MKFSEIVSLAKNVNEYTEKNGTLPSKSNGYSVGEYSYILWKSVLNPNKEIVKLTYSNAPNPNGDSVKKTLTKKEFTDMATHINAFVSKNKRLPNNVSYQNKKINIQLAVYCFAKIIIFYNSNKRLPSTCLFDSSVLSKKTATKTTNTSNTSKYGHATKQGCDNMGQNTSYYCACHSLQEVIRNLYNIVIPQKTLASVMGTTTSGTGHDGIHTAVAWFNKKYSKKLSMSEKYFSDLGASGLKKIIYSNNKDFIVHLAYQGKYGHYEVVNSIGDSTWNIQNSLGSKCSGSCYCGHKETRSYATEKAWINAKTGVKSILVFTKGG